MGDVRDIYGIGDKKANDLKKHYNIRTVFSLRQYVRKIPYIITDAQKAGLRYHDKINKHVTLATAKKHADYIADQLPGATIAGSYRRGERVIGDIDVLILTDISKAVAKLVGAGYVVATLASGDEKFSGIARIPGTENYRRIDIMKTTREEKPFALLYFTGDYVYNISMRQKAKKMKLSLSQHGLKSMATGKMVKGLRTERDIFKYLGIPYAPPEERSKR